MSQQGTHWLWHWSGRCFGYRQGDRLLADDGQQLGRFVAERIFDRNGRYIGEIRPAGDGGEGRRLATRLADLALQHDGFEPVRGDRKVLPADQPPLPMPVGYRRFPLASELKRHFAPVPAPAARSSDATRPSDTSQPANARQPADAAPAKPAARIA